MTCVRDSACDRHSGNMSCHRYLSPETDVRPSPPSLQLPFRSILTLLLENPSSSLIPHSTDEARMLPEPSP